MKYANYVKSVLKELIDEMDHEREKYVVNPNKDFTRKRKLDFGVMMNTIISMGSSSLKNELLQHFNFDINTVTTSAFVQQRNKIKSAAFEKLFYKFNDHFHSEKLFKGYRLLAVDGSGITFSADRNQQDYYRETNQFGHAIGYMHLNAMYDLLNRKYIDVQLQSAKTMNERLAKKEMIMRYHSDDKTIFIADRGYENYNNFMHIMKKEKNFLVRVKDKDSNGILSGLKLPETDEFDIDVNLILTRRHTNFVKENSHIYKFMPQHQNFDFMDENKECPISFRVVRIKIDEDKYEAIITNLDRDDFMPRDLKSLYSIRWGVESSFRHLKHIVGLNSFHAKKVESIKQEIFAMLIIHNFCEIIAAKADLKQKKPTKHLYQLNFTHTFRICRQFFRLPKWIEPPNVEKLILRERLPVRKNRSFKRKKSNKSEAVGFNYRTT